MGTAGVDAAEGRSTGSTRRSAVTSDANELKVDIGHVALRGESPHIGLNDLSGIIRRHEDSITIENLSLRTEETSLRVGGSIRGIDSGNPVINLKASSDKFAMNEAAKLVPALRGYENLQPAFEINASGPADRLDVAVERAREGTRSGRRQSHRRRRRSERRIAGAVQTEHFNVGPLVRGSRRSRPTSPATRRWTWRCPPTAGRCAGRTR